MKLVPATHSVLRQVAATVPLEKITTKKIQTFIKNLRQVLAREPDGVAIAAPQIGIPLRIFAVSEKILSAATPPRGREPVKTFPVLVCINPTIIKRSREKQWMTEGCLSLRYLYGRVHRSRKVTIETYDEKGKRFVRGASGLLAQIFQHEIDHLNGALFTDTAKNVVDRPPEDTLYLRGESMS